ncbi:hypothetical protein AB0346_00225 [Nocardia beijingensis]|uniref:hypothetical protein n=1 Tax=Nocardia beijingensis TaxID=95162 RepID=UPI00344BBD7D
MTTQPTTLAAAGIELARCAAWLLDTRAVRIADHFACTGLRACAFALRTLPRRAATITSRSLL